MNGSGFLAMVLLSVAAAGGSTDEVGADLFEVRVRPVLVEKCLDCHGEEEPEGGLRLTSRTSLLKGGQGGPVVLEGRPEQSRLIAAIRREGPLQMPPDGALSAAEIQAVARWIEQGLPWPDAATANSAANPQSRVSDADRQHWAFRPITDPPVPAVQNTEWPRTSVDRFVLAKLEAPDCSRHRWRTAIRC